MQVIDLDKNTVVESGAGGGKTFQIVKALIQGLVEKKFTIDQVVAITFTIKAAAELQERIILELEEQAGHSGSAHLHEQLALTGSANISTIHAFCSSILKERPVEANLDPNFEVIPEEDGQFFQETFNLWLHENSDEFADFLAEVVLEKELPLRTHRGEQKFSRNRSLEDLMWQVVNHRELEPFVPAEPEGSYNLHDFYSEANAMRDQVSSGKLALQMAAVLQQVGKALHSAP